MPRVTTLSRDRDVHAGAADRALGLIEVDPQRVQAVTHVGELRENRGDVAAFLAVEAVKVN